MTATTTITVPSTEELAPSLSALRAAEEAVADLYFAIKRVAEFEGTETPTYDDLGRVFAWTVESKMYLDELNRYAKEITDALDGIDYVRVLGNVDPDAGTCSVCGRQAVRAVIEREQWEYHRDNMDGFTCFCRDCKGSAPSR